MNKDNSAKKTSAPDLACANILVTGGSGFIGSNFIRHVLAKPDFRGIIVNVDKLTYAGNPANLSDIEANFGGKRYFFVQADICDFSRMRNVFETHRIDRVVHFAAESHVDRSIFGPKEFVETNIVGTFSLLEAARASWAGVSGARFHHISTDEVYGSLGETGFFIETTPYDPRSPYSASKASSDHLVRAYSHTYGLPVSISNCSNNYGPYHFPEKLIPLAILNALEGKDIPVYGDGRNVRDWLFVEDHCDAVWTILAKGRPGETYNIGGECEQQNIQVVTAICDILEDLAPSRGNRAIKNRLPSVRGYRDLITFVSDRPGHDRRYAINCDKIKNELGWRQKHDFKGGLRTTVAWYLNNSGWVSAVRSGEYRTWLEKNYTRRPS